jgi:hypothetical protein
MKTITMGGLLLAQLAIAAQPASAATLHDQEIAARQSVGAFAGGRVRIQLGGRTAKASAGLALAPMGRSVGQDGSVRLRLGEGVDFASTNGGAPGLRLAGRPIEEVRKGFQDKEADEDDGLSPVAIGAIVIGGLVVAAGIGYVILINNIGEED